MDGVFLDTRVDRQTDKQTFRHADRTTSHPHGYK